MQNNKISDASDGNQSDWDQIACTVCYHLLREYTRKRSWLICDKCNKYVCPDSVLCDTDLEQDFSCKKYMQE